MDEQIKDKLQDIWKNLEIDVEYLDFRKYKIVVNSATIRDSFEIIYDVHLTFDTNISYINNKISNLIIEYYRR